MHDPKPRKEQRLPTEEQDADPPQNPPLPPSDGDGEEDDTQQ